MPTSSWSGMTARGRLEDFGELCRHFPAPPGWWWRGSPLHAQAGQRPSHLLGRRRFVATASNSGRRYRTRSTPIMLSIQPPLPSGRRWLNPFGSKRVTWYCSRRRRRVVVAGGHCATEGQGPPRGSLDAGRIGAVGGPLHAPPGRSGGCRGQRRPATNGPACSSRAHFTHAPSAGGEAVATLPRRADPRLRHRCRHRTGVLASVSLLGTDPVPSHLPRSSLGQYNRRPRAFRAGRSLIGTRPVPGVSRLIGEEDAHRDTEGRRRRPAEARPGADLRRARSGSPGSDQPPGALGQLGLSDTQCDPDRLESAGVLGCMHGHASSVASPWSQVHAEQMKKRPEPSEQFSLADAVGPWASVELVWSRSAASSSRRGLRRWDPTGERAEDDGEEWLCAQTDQGRRQPLSLKKPGTLLKPSLARRFEVLGNNPSLAKILAFANEFGFLGTPVMLIAPGPGLTPRSPSAS